jgi:hypothetical protein
MYLKWQKNKAYDKQLHYYHTKWPIITHYKRENFPLNNKLEGKSLRPSQAEILTGLRLPSTNPICPVGYVGTAAQANATFRNV